jgi:hypothetical protein
MSLFYNYEETYKILNDKFNITHDELWFYSHKGINYINGINVSSSSHICLLPFISDIPKFDKTYEFTNSGSNIKFCFYQKEYIDSFIPLTYERFVYIKDLAGKRNWPRHTRSDTNLYSEFPALDEAANNYLLRFYDGEKNVFTYKKDYQIGNEVRSQLWIQSIDGQEYLSQPDNFFLLQDIINIERIFYKRPLVDCLIELEIDPKEYV